MIVVGIATILSRIEQLKKTIESLLPQVDKIHVSMNHPYLNALPEWLLTDKVHGVIVNGSDEQKFRQVEGDIFLSCDDDLIYPKNYVKIIKQTFEDYAEIERRNCSTGNSDIITFHGRNFNSFPIQSYYKSAGSKYRCLDKVSTDIPVQVGGTGCMAFRPSNFNVTLSDFPSKYMADVHLAIAAKKQGKRIMCIAHEKDWIKYQPVNDTIYDRFKDRDFEQTERINEAFGVNVPRGTI